MSAVVERLSPTLAFQRETLEMCLEEAIPLLHAHWAEVAPHRDIKLDPDYNTYRKLEAARVLRVYTIREAGVLVGYAAFTVMPNMKYRTSLQATADLLYLEPRLRKTLLAGRFLAWCDDALRAEGVQIVRHSVERTLDFGHLLEHLGYEQEQVIYCRRLDTPRG